MRRRIWIILGVFLFLLALNCIGFSVPPVVLIGFLAIGWISYLARVIPQVQVNWPGLVSAVFCLLAVFFVAHLVARWFWRETRDSNARTQAWQPQWTLAAVGIIVLAFLAGIAAVGIAHQTAWLIRSEQPMWQTSSRARFNRIRCASNLRQIALAIEKYANAHDHQLPDTLAELLTAGDLSGRVFTCPASNTEAAEGATVEELAKNLQDHTDYVYRGRGLKWPAPARFAVLCEPLIDHDDEGMNILFGDGRVEWITPTEAQKALHVPARAGDD